MKLAASDWQCTVSTIAEAYPLGTFALQEEVEIVVQPEGIGWFLPFYRFKGKPSAGSLSMAAPDDSLTFMGYGPIKLQFRHWYARPVYWLWRIWHYVVPIKRQLPEETETPAEGEE